ncbi:2-oxo acid dehydrogenase subunit E2 [Rhodocytophaga rosea]|uniref:Dihydrolipoamide acetyltransferase component of pyruvate dehydrogenase complex n=1 Tax=Rhodocytophaga rosea TaxID=2704465 RepID=A0A6C0GKV7_9BACT|nr:dihydrolipoamide acetyltransferase family protein [Rhodocytophaga rosea]QHT68293.1 2-oxo acid dehydrogenase subunit E2 [Rhodocytophaga rosea]
MAQIEMLMPKMGESIMEGTILKWLKKVGDKIEQDESVLEVATDKVDTEVPAIHGGILKEILAQEGQVVEIGKAIAIISTDVEASNGSNGIVAPVTTTAQQETKEEEKQASILESQITSMTASNGFSPLSKPASGRFYSPLVLTIAREENIPMQELEYIPGSGADKRVTKKDILNYIANRPNDIPAITEIAVPATKEADYENKQINSQVNEVPQPETSKPSVTPVPEKVNKSVDSQPAVLAPTVSYSGQADIIEMDRMRKMIAQRMVDSKRISPHVTSFVEADVTNIVFWRNRIKNEFKAKEGDAITFTPIFIEALAKALKDYPMVNASVEGDKIIVKKDINIGMAVALPSGNLIVPVIKNADQLNIVGLTKRVNDLARRARENKLTADDLSGGTYTMSNVGSFGNVMGTPIIVQPQIAIMAFGTVQKKPAVIETPLGDTIGIRHFMFLSHSYDHRVVDGALGGMFVRKVADYLEGYDLHRKVF